MTTVIMPSAPLGIDSNTSKKALTVRSHVLRDWLVDACRSLSRMGFSQFICFSGHLGPKQLTAIEEANKILKKNIFNRFKPLLQRPHLISASSCFTNLKDMIHSPFIPSPPEHGGEKDTSLALLIAPELVDKQYQTLPIADKSPQGFNRWLAWHQKKIDGYWGDPSHATEEKGRIFISDSIKKFKPLLEDILSGKPERSRFRSWYSIVPSNKSFYKAWILFLLSACVMLAWIFFTLKTI